MCIQNNPLQEYIYILYINKNKIYKRISFFYVSILLQYYSTFFAELFQISS